MNDKIYTFRDAKMNSLPLRLINTIGAGAAACGLRYPNLSADDIRAAAQRRTGLDDFGDAGIHEALQQYVDSAENESHLNLLGRFAARNMLVNALSNRLQVIDWAKQHPQIKEEQIEQPWIVVGLPRTGTSLLCSLLGLDPGSRPLLQWEAARPMPPAELATAAEDPRIAAFANDVKRVLQISPALGAMHPFGSTLAEECTAVFTYSLRTIGIETIGFVPSYGHWLDRCDMRPAYALHKTVLQAFQHAQPTDRWVLKSPNHLWCLDAMLATYPNARVVWMHRDPADVVTSLASINNAMQISFTNKHDPVRVGNYWADKIVDGIAKGSAFDATQPEGWCQHVQYDDLMADTAGTVEKLYRSFGDTVQPLHRRRVNAWLQHRPQNAFGRHGYDPRD
ncbi:MAG TPA: sulfotransferase, partial [Spongiibacteraceae bacterium]|nr:sulfotransferase [Spongiibacteraceae bacterium]